MYPVPPSSSESVNGATADAISSVHNATNATSVDKSSGKKKNKTTVVIKAKPPKLLSQGSQTHQSSFPKSHAHRSGEIQYFDPNDQTVQPQELYQRQHQLELNGTYLNRSNGVKEKQQQHLKQQLQQHPYQPKEPRRLRPATRSTLSLPSQDLAASCINNHNDYAACLTDDDIDDDDEISIVDFSLTSEKTRKKCSPTSSSTSSSSAKSQEYDFGSPRFKTRHLRIVGSPQRQRHARDRHAAERHAERQAKDPHHVTTAHVAKKNLNLASQESLDREIDSDEEDDFDDAKEDYSEEHLDSLTAAPKKPVSRNGGYRGLHRRPLLRSFAATSSTSKEEEGEEKEVHLLRLIRTKKEELVREIEELRMEIEDVDIYMESLSCTSPDPLMPATAPTTTTTKAEATITTTILTPPTMTNLSPFPTSDSLVNATMNSFADETMDISRDDIDDSVIDNSVIDNSVINQSLFDPSFIDQSTIDYSMIDDSILDDSLLTTTIPPVNCLHNNQHLHLHHPHLNNSPHQQRTKRKTNKLGLARKKFNMDPKKGIAFLISECLDGEGSPSAIASFLHRGEGLNKTAIGDFLGSNEEFNLKVLDEFLRLHEFHDVILVQALRQFLWSFRLPGEAQKIDRMMEAFAKRYCDCNPTVFSPNNVDTCYVLSFAVIMLNTSLHNPNIKESHRQTLDQFISMNKGINGGEDLNRQLLVDLFESIKKEPFKIPLDDSDDLVFTFFNPDKEGWLLKQGGRVKSWKRRWFILNDNCLYYFEHTTDKEPRGIIPLENLQVREVSDKSKKFCFELFHANSEIEKIKACKTKPDGKLVEGRHKVYRMSASSWEERQEWMKHIQSSCSQNPFLDFLIERKKSIKSAQQRNHSFSSEQPQQQQHQFSQPLPPQRHQRKTGKSKSNDDLSDNLMPPTSTVSNGSARPRSASHAPVNASTSLDLSNPQPIASATLNTSSNGESRSFGFMSRRRSATENRRSGSGSGTNIFSSLVSRLSVDRS